MIHVAQAREKARTRLRAQRAEWAARPPSGAPALRISLRPPSERDMLADQASAECWAREWLTLPAANGVRIDLEPRSWRSIGRQLVPVRLVLADPDAVAKFVGGEPAAQWRQLNARAKEIRAHFGDSDAVAATIRHHAETLLGYEAERFTAVITAARWLVDNPVTGLRPRQLPIRGADTKWFAANRAVLSSLCRAVTGSDDLGILNADPLIRLRVLDSALGLGGPNDLAAPLPVLASLPYRPQAVFVFENLESVLAMPSWPGAIVVHGGGYAVDGVGRLPWVREVAVLYWGDLDSHGFAILNRLRLTHPRVTSVLMDQAVLLAHQDLWVREPSPHRGRFDTLTDAESRTLDRLRAEGDIRLEQERIPWHLAVCELRAAWNRSGASSTHAAEPPPYARVVGKEAFDADGDG